MDRATRLSLFDAVRAEQGLYLETILWRLTGDRELFAEALQESLMQIWRHVEQLQGPASRAYVYRIAQSSASQAWRRRPRPAGGGVDDREAPIRRPDEEASTNELTVLVRRAISELPEQQSRAITMRYLEQNEYEAMAREMDCSEATLRSHVSKALAALRDVLATVDRGVRKA